MKKKSQQIITIMCRYDLEGKTVGEVREAVGLDGGFVPYVKGQPVGESHSFDGWNLEFRK